MDTTFTKGPFKNYVTHFLLVFDHPPTYSNALAIIFPMTYHNSVSSSNAFDNNPPLLRYVIFERPQILARLHL